MMTTLICNIYPLCKFGQLHVTSSKAIGGEKNLRQSCICTV